MNPDLKPYKKLTDIKHVLETQQFKNPQVLQDLFFLADEMRLLDKKELNKKEQEKAKQLKLSLKPRQKTLTTLFYEPSTRTRLSFESAMLSLNGKVTGTESASHFSSAVKGESLFDTIKVVSGYCDIIVLRHPGDNSSKDAAQHSSVPLINGGAGREQHPTQALLDLYTIKRELGRMDNLKVGMLGDLANGRTVRSLSYLLANINNKTELTFIAPKQLQMRDDIKRYLGKKSIPFKEILNPQELQTVSKNLDVLYITRLQTERMNISEGEKKKLRKSYVVNKSIVNAMPRKSIIMHPLPRVTEIDKEIDSNQKSAYFRQAKNGKYLRMALLKSILDSKGTQQCLEEFEG